MKTVFAAIKKAAFAAFFMFVAFYLQEPGKYFVGIGLVAAGPQAQEVITTPGFDVASAVALRKGDKEILFAVVVTAPPKVVALPTTVITPAAVKEPDVTYFV